jgi:hypothetical protein
MTTIPTPAQYYRVPQQAQSGGIAVLRLPIQRLWREYLARFVRHGLAWLCEGRVLDDAHRHLEETGLTEAAISLSDWLPERLPETSQYKWDARQADLVRLAAASQDLASDGGQWREQFADLRDLADQGASDILSGCRTLVAQVLRTHGPAAGRQALTEVSAALERARQDTHQKIDEYPAKCWPASRSPELRIVGESLRHAARPRGRLVPLLGRVFPAIAGRLALSQAQRGAIRRHLRTLNAAQADRYYLALLKARRRALDELLGLPGRPGRLSRLFAAIKAQADCLHDLSRPFAATDREPPRRRPTELLLVDTIQTVIDPGTKHTLADLYDERLRQAGYSSRHWADRLAADGLVICGQVYLPHQWPELDRPSVVRHLVQSAQRYLGLNRPEPGSQSPNASAALECLAGVTMLDEALKGLVDQILPLLIARSRPYATCRPISGAQLPDLAFFYCHPAQRAVWLEKLPYLQHADEAMAARYAISDPYVLILSQYRLGIPAGALHGLSAAMATAAKGYRAHNTVPFRDRHDYPEYRLLGSRPKDHASAQHLFDVAAKARLVLSVGEPATGYVLTYSDPRLDRLFAPHTYVPAIAGADFFHHVLKSCTEFAVLVRAALPRLSEFHKTRLCLAGENNSERVAVELIALGILKRTPTGQYQMAFLPPTDTFGGLGDLYTVEIGPTTGLSRDHFIAALQDNDLLYNVLFWGVRDAWHTGRLCDNDVPAFVREFQDDEGLLSGDAKP